MPCVDGTSPPPIPLASKPNRTAPQIQTPAVGRNDGPTFSNPPKASCSICRDFSGPDHHAARFPRQSVPSGDLGWLANQLTAPFLSHTDKARAIFTWLHHNVSYDTASFFGNCVKPSTPQSTLLSGLAVCEGYAGLFATLAIKAGLEAYVVAGASKGYGHVQHQAGDPIPAYKSDHAWNVVKIDDGEWKLIDSCWGAGHVNENRQWVVQFHPARFVGSNNDFGLDHYPGDPSKQFRTDGRVLSWEDFMLASKEKCGANVCGVFEAEGMSTASLTPHEGSISVSGQPGPTVRFSFQKVCPHWDPVRNGNGPCFLYILSLSALERDTRNGTPFRSDGQVWWCDIPVKDLGQPGDTARIMSLKHFGGEDGRGLTTEKYQAKKGKVGWAGQYHVKWEITA